MCFKSDIQRHMLMLKEMASFFNQLFMCSNPLMEVSVGFLIELTHGGLLQVLIFHSNLLCSFWLNWFMEVLLKWLSGTSCRYYSTLLWFLWMALFARISFSLRRKMHWSGIKTKIRGLVTWRLSQTINTSLQACPFILIIIYPFFLLTYYNMSIFFT